MATQAEILRITRRSESLKSLTLGEAPQLEPAAFARFPEMAASVRAFNEQNKRSYDRLKNLLAEALMSARDLPP